MSEGQEGHHDQEGGWHGRHDSWNHPPSAAAGLPPPQRTGAPQPPAAMPAPRRVDHTYHDYSEYPISQLPAGKKRANNFPSKLHQILSTHEYSHIISWMSHGRAWKVHDKELLVRDVIPKYFVQTKYESFTRQLNGWGFKRLLQSGMDFNAFYHESFLRDRPHLVVLLKRVEPNKGKLLPHVEGEPNFYQIDRQFPLPPVVSPYSGHYYSPYPPSANHTTSSAEGYGPPPPDYSPYSTGGNSYGPPPPPYYGDPRHSAAATAAYASSAQPHPPGYPPYPYYPPHQYPHQSPYEQYPHYPYPPGPPAPYGTPPAPPSHHDNYASNANTGSVKSEEGLAPYPDGSRQDGSDYAGSSGAKQSDFEPLSFVDPPNNTENDEDEIGE